MALSLVHNISQRNLKKGIALGGLPCPSLAVINADKPYTKYGDITLVRSMASFNFKRYPAHESDIYSARVPLESYKVNAKSVDKFMDKLSEHCKESCLSDYIAQIDSFLRSNGSSGFDNLFDSFLSVHFVAKLAFLRSQGDIIPIPEKPMEPNFKYSSNEEFVDRLVDTYNGQERGAGGISAFSRKVAELYQQQLDVEMASTQEATELDDSDIAEIKQKIERAMFIKTDAGKQVKPHYIQNIVEYISAMKEGITIPDIKELESVVEEKVKSIKAPAFENWLRENLKHAFSEPYFTYRTDSGNQVKKAFTSDNIVRYMKRQGKNVDSVGFSGASGIRAMFSRPLTSLSEIGKRENSLLSEDEFSEFKARIDKDYIDITSEITSLVCGTDAKARDFFKVSDIAKDVIYDYARTGRKKILHEINDTQLPQEIVDKVDVFIDTLKVAPTEYLEVKENRSVEISEFSAAIIPSCCDPEVVEYLDSVGVSAVIYEKFNAESRMEALHQAQRLVNKQASIELDEFSF